MAPTSSREGCDRPSSCGGRRRSSTRWRTRRTPATRCPPRRSRAPSVRAPPTPPSRSPPAPSRSASRRSAAPPQRHRAGRRRRFGASGARVPAPSATTATAPPLGPLGERHGGAGTGGMCGGGTARVHDAARWAARLRRRAGVEAFRLRHERPLGLMQAYASDAAANWILCGSSTGHWCCGTYATRCSCAAGGRRPRAASTRCSTCAPGPSRPTVLMGTDDNLVLGGGDWRDAAPLPPLQTATTPDATGLAALALPPPRSRALLRRLLRLLSRLLLRRRRRPRRARAPLVELRRRRRRLRRHAPLGARAARPLDGSFVLSATRPRLRCWQLAGDAAGSFVVGGQPAELRPSPSRADEHTGAGQLPHPPRARVGERRRRWRVGGGSAQLWGPDDAVPRSGHVGRVLRSASAWAAARWLPRRHAARVEVIATCSSAGAGQGPSNERESVPSVFETLQPAAPGSVVDLTELTVTRLA